MSEKKFKTRLEIAKKRFANKNNENSVNKSSVLGAAFKMSTEFVAAVAVGTIMWIDDKCNCQFPSLDALKRFSTISTMST